MRTCLGTISEIQDLTALALASKRHWGYDDYFIELCRAELSVSEEDVDTDSVFVVEDEIGNVVGFYLLAESPRPELRMLFVSPDVIGRGIGKVLVHDALSVAKSRGRRSLVIESDPFAESFYEHLGAELVGASQSVSTGRTLRLYEMRAEG
jgi:GNAT superfamily N-acetyltransferase